MNHDTNNDNGDELQDELLPVPEVDGRYGYLLTNLVLCSLPMRDPGTDQDWVRSNGAWKLTVGAGWYRDKTGRKVRMMPYGKVGRGIVLGICTEYKRTGERRVELGDSLTGYLTQLGIPLGGQQRRDVLRMLWAVATMTLETEEPDTVDGIDGYVETSDLITRRRGIYFGLSDVDGQDSLLGPSWLELDPLFTEALDTHSMPVDMEAWAWLNKASKSALPIDIYTWLSYRLPYVSGRGVTIPWEGIFNQFGSGNTTNPTQARKQFSTALELVLKVYPAAVGKVELTREGVQLRRAASPITRRKPKGLAS